MASLFPHLRQVLSVIFYPQVSAAFAFLLGSRVNYSRSIPAHNKEQIRDFCKVMMAYTKKMLVPSPVHWFPWPFFTSRRTLFNFGKIGFLVSLRRHTCWFVDASAPFASLPEDFNLVFTEADGYFFKTQEMIALDNEIGDLDCFIKDVRGARREGTCVFHSSVKTSPLTFSLSLSLSHTHTHTHTLSLSLSTTSRPDGSRIRSGP